MIELDRHEGIGTIRIAREEKLNAMTPEMGSELSRLAAEVNSDGEVRVVVLTGGPKVFCAGSDIKALDQYPHPWDYRVRQDDYTRAVRRIRKPVIAMVSGYCLGGGLEMAVNSDIRYADTTAQFGAPEVTWGWIGGGGASQILPRLVGFGHAMELLVSGRRIGAEEAARIGLVEKVFPPERLSHETYRLAAEIAERAPLATQVIKQAVRVALNTGVELGLDYENELVYLTFSTEDKAEGVRAFSEKRKPRFKGR